MVLPSQLGGKKSRKHNKCVFTSFFLCQSQLLHLQNSTRPHSLLGHMWLAKGSSMTPKLGMHVITKGYTHAISASGRRRVGGTAESEREGCPGTHFNVQPRWISEWKSENCDYSRYVMHFMWLLVCTLIKFSMKLQSGFYCVAHKFREVCSAAWMGAAAVMQMCFIGSPGQQCRVYLDLGLDSSFLA